MTAVPRVLTVHQQRVLQQAVEELARASAEWDEQVERCVNGEAAEASASYALALLKNRALFQLQVVSKALVGEDRPAEPRVMFVLDDHQPTMVHLIESSDEVVKHLRGGYQRISAEYDEFTPEDQFDFQDFLNTFGDADVAVWVLSIDNA